MSCQVPRSVELVIPSVNEGVVDEEGYFGSVALTASALSNGLRFSCYHLVRDVFNFLEIAPAQFSPHSWRALLCSYVVFCMALELFRGKVS